MSEKASVLEFAATMKKLSEIVKLALCSLTESKEDLILMMEVTLAQLQQCN